VKRSHGVGWVLAGVLTSLLCASQMGLAQDPVQDPTQDPTGETKAPVQPEHPAAKPTRPVSKKNSDTPLQSAADQPEWDPLRAEKDLEVGQYYLKKGDVDAAIDRFEDAAKAKPGYALPFRYLGEAQEKKGLKREAIKSYTRYLDLYPHAEDAEKIRKRIDKLWRESEKKKSSK
jgi:tetratricopeptide (TPR) repeat protein